MTEVQEILNLFFQSSFFRALKLIAWILFVVTWLGMLSFVAKDASRRYFKKAKQISVVFLPLFLHLAGFLFYLFIRPSKTKAEKIYEENLLKLTEGELFSCPHCGSLLEKNFIYCPRCGKNVFTRCPNCGEPVKEDWNFCPYCKRKL